MGDRDATANHFKSQAYSVHAGHADYKAGQTGY